MMYIYLSIINWCQLLILAFIAFYNNSIGNAITIGSFVGFISSSGFLSYLYYKDIHKNINNVDDVNEIWMKNLFNKDYLVEIYARICLLFILFAWSFLFLHSFMLFLCGLQIMWVAEVLVEYAISLYVKRKNK